MKEFQIEVRKVVTLKEGYGTYFIPIWSSEDEDRIADVAGGVVRIAPDTVTVIGGEACVKAEDDLYIPVTEFRELEDLPYDDTHDLRNRWFASEEEAREHLEYTLSRFQNPLPWESFVEVG